jgi:hypothetical protein
VSGSAPASLTIPDKLVALADEVIEAAGVRKEEVTMIAVIFEVRPKPDTGSSI